MGIQFTFDTAAAIDFVDGLLMDVARRVQVPPSKHEEAIAHYTGLCEHVDRVGSPLEDKVLENYPSGSFSIHAAIYTKVRSLQHDVDVVVEVDVPEGTDPEWMLDTLFSAIKGQPGSKYYDFPIKRNSRCITVTYPDGVTVDLMPVLRIPSGPERSGHLFHHKQEDGEKLLKEVNPKAFTNHFNSTIVLSGVSDAFAAKFRSRRMLVDGLLVDKADTQPMPGHLPLEEKSPRLVAIQLLKRFRDVQYRTGARKKTRKPPSVVIAAVALDAGPMTDSLFDELCAISWEFCRRIDIAEMNQTTLVVKNPTHNADEFTDRWPEDRHSQLVWKRDLNNLISTLSKLKTSNFDGSNLKRELTNLFGETLADRAIEEHYRGQAEVAKHNQLGVTKTGGIRSMLAAPAIASALTMPARANTNMGGSIEYLND